MDKEKMLPLGSVVRIKDVKDALLIIGIGASVEDKKYDYSACIHPYGYQGVDKLALFNYDQIEEVIFLGYYDEESEEYYDDIMWLEGQNKEGNDGE